MEDTSTSIPVEKNLAQRRKNEWKFAARNKKISEIIGYEEKPLHYYAKNAPEFYLYRSNKTNNKGKHRKAYGNYYPSKNWSITDQKKIDSLNEQIEENNNEVD